VSESILMGYAEVSELTGIPILTLKDYRAKGIKGPRSALVAGKVKYKRADVLGWIDEQFEKSGKGGMVKPVAHFFPLGNRSLVDA
jgi:hypothetical protein